jgi:hypothetical protein
LIFIGRVGFDKTVGLTRRVAQTGLEPVLDERRSSETVWLVIIEDMLEVKRSWDKADETKVDETRSGW